MKGIERILSFIGLNNLVEKLSSKNINWADFHTLLLSVFEKRIEEISPADIMENYEKNRLSAISTINPKEMMEVDRAIYGILPDCFSAVELSPVNPIGINSALTPLNSKVVLSTIRNMDVVSDSGMALAIECALRRKALKTIKESLCVHLATSHRVLRLQNFSKDSGLVPHFRSFALASAARDTEGFNRFEMRSLSMHIETWLKFLDTASEMGYCTKKISVVISDMRLVEKIISGGRVSRQEVIRGAKDKTFDLLSTYPIGLSGRIESMENIPVAYPELETCIRELQFTEKQIIKDLREKYPSVLFYFDLSRCSGIGYYSGLCYRVTAENFAGNKHSLAGGGACDWTKKLLGSRRERLVTGGFGTEMFHNLFKK